MPAAGDHAVLQVDGSDILVFVPGVNAPKACTGGTATLTNTDVITVRASGDTGHLLTIEDPSQFAPGATTVGEGEGTPEIEIFVNLNDGPGSQLVISTGPAGASVRLGTSGINPNAVPGEVAPDVDVYPSEVPGYQFFGGSGADTFGAQGGAGTGSAFAGGLVLTGDSGNDSLVGGEGIDAIRGGPGDDTLLGLGGNDTLEPGSRGGSDSLDGGEGIDVARYDALAVGVSVDLAISGPQGQGGSLGDSFTEVENVLGTKEADVLRGDAGPNALSGREGADVLEGRGGPDILFAGEGDDSLDVRDGGPDLASCGDNEDTVIADPPGIDTMVDCETVLSAQPPGAGDDTPPAAPAQPGAPPPPLPGPPQNVPPVLTGLRVAPAAFPALARRSASGPTREPRVSYVLSETATTTFTVQRALPGRRAGRACERPTRRNRRARRCTRWTAQRGSLTRAGRQGANSFRFTGRLNRQALAVGSYRLIAQARDSGGQRSRTVRRGFRIVR
jgi:hypothetical protein